MGGVHGGDPTVEIEAPPVVVGGESAVGLEVDVLIPLISLRQPDPDEGVVPRTVGEGEHDRVAVVLGI